MPTTRSRARAEQTASKTSAQERKLKLEQLSSPPPTPQPTARQTLKGSVTKAEFQAIPNLKAPQVKPTALRSRKRKHGDIIPSPPSDNEHNEPQKEEDHSSLSIQDDPIEPVKKKPRSRKNIEAGLALQDLARRIGIPGADAPRLSYLEYAYVPGQSPFPELLHPTPEECAEVYRRLAKLHGEARLEEVAPMHMPSLQRAGCGDVPAVLDALIRTYLSSHTTDAKSTQALKGLVKDFGLASVGAGKGSPDYNAVHAADLNAVEAAIKAGGMAAKKSASIRKLLQVVARENEDWGKGESKHVNMLNANVEDGADFGHDDVAATAQKDIADDPLSLQYVSLLPTPQAIMHLVEYPGIGLKTAACVALYCLRRPIFPVDTHVQRICQGLGWTYQGANENKTFMHGQVMIPDEYKYGLHHLFVMHGKACARCRGGSREGGKGWEEDCPIDDLLDRKKMRPLEKRAKQET